MAFLIFQELVNTVKTLTAKLEDLSTCADLIGKHGSALNGSLSALRIDRIMVRIKDRIILKKMPS